MPKFIVSHTLAGGVGADSTKVEADGWRERDGFVEFYADVEGGGDRTVWAMKKERVHSIQAE